MAVRRRKALANVKASQTLILFLPLPSHTTTTCKSSQASRNIHAHDSKQGHTVNEPQFHLRNIRSWLKNFMASIHNPAIEVSGEWTFIMWLELLLRLCPLFLFIVELNKNEIDSWILHDFHQIENLLEEFSKQCYFSNMLRAVYSNEDSWWAIITKRIMSDGRQEVFFPILFFIFKCWIFLIWVPHRIYSWQIEIKIFLDLWEP